MIASGRYPGTRELAEADETSMSSISRDIEFMRDRLGAPIEYDARHRNVEDEKANRQLVLVVSVPVTFSAIKINQINPYR
jgi:predicted DNA-binding transcriptional regulator YafY